jgi:DNA-directed RNA polymerase III subunit Rpc31
MAERGGGRGGRGRRGGRNIATVLAQQLGTTATALRKAVKAGYEPEPTFPNFLVPRPTKLTQDETTTVKYYKNMRNKIVEETPFYITGRKRPADDEDDGRKFPFHADGRDYTV